MVIGLAAMMTAGTPDQFKLALISGIGDLACSTSSSNVVASGSALSPSHLPGSTSSRRTSRSTTGSPKPTNGNSRGTSRSSSPRSYFEGCGGLELTDEIKVTIAAQACLLLLHRETDYYPRLITILVYPHAYVAKSVEPIGGGVVLEGETARLGEAWKDGVVVLSWDDVRQGASDLHDGHNVVLHEFAHQLDQQDGSADGAPILEHRSQYVTWARVLSDEYEQLRRDTEQGRKDVLDEYGATNPAEFFAVATECFFEKPIPLRRKHPQLYEELKAYYRQDPASLVSS